MFRFALFLFYESEAGPIIQYINKMGDYVFCFVFAKCEYSTLYCGTRECHVFVEYKRYGCSKQTKRDHLQLILKGHYAMLRGGNSENL